MKTRFLMCCSLVALVLFAAEAKPAKVRELAKDVFAYGEPWLPLTVLAEQTASRENHSIRRFKVTWGYAGPHHGDGGTAIYDRPRQSLWVEYSSFWWQGLDEGETLIRQHRSIQRWRFSHITPAKMQRLLDKYRGKVPDADRQPAYFPRLIEVGCRRRVLLNRQTSWREKWVKEGKTAF